MSHEALREKLLDLAYGELPPREARRVEEHAASCEACRGELARIRGTRRIMSALPDEPAPERGERILVAAARERAEARRRRRLLPPWIWGAAAAAFSLVVVAAVSYRILAMRPGPDDEPLLGTGPYQSAPPPDAAAGEAPRSPDASLSPREAPPHADTGAPSSGDAQVAPSPRRSGGEGDRASRAERRGKAGDRATPDEPASRYAQPPPPPPAAPAGAPAPAPADSGAVPEPAERSAGEPSAADSSRFTPPPAPSAPRSGDDAGRASRAAPSEKAARAPEVSDAPAAAEAPARGEVAAAEAEPLRRAPRVDAPSRSAPDASRAEAAPPAAAAAPRPLRAAPPDAALERWQALRDAGALREEVRTFPRCDGEAVRRVELDPEGRLVRYVREGRIGGRRLRVEHVYGLDGRLAVATVRDLDAPGAKLDADALGLDLPADAGEARLDAPPRCGP